MIRVDIKPGLWRWAVERAGSQGEALRERFPQLEEWERGDAKPTLKQLETFAKAAHVAVGYLFLTEPPDEKLPIPDLRTVGSQGVRRPSADLLDAVYLCQRRQAWYQEYAESLGEDVRDFVGSARVSSSAERVAAEMRQRLRFNLEQRREYSSWEDALRQFIQHAEEAGVLVMVSGVVGSNNTRKLDPNEFRGFALADKLAPLVFINGSDAKAAQMFTLAHELAHLWLGQSAVSDAGLAGATSQAVEAWCNRVAAELLVPLAELRRELGSADGLRELPQLARTFKVSKLVLLRRLLDAGKLTREKFQTAYGAELARLAQQARSGGGNFYLTQGARLSKRFARALIASTLSGQTLFRDAFQMLGIAKEQTFRELGRSLEVIP